MTKLKKLFQCVIEYVKKIEFRRFFDAIPNLVNSIIDLVTFLPALVRKKFKSSSFWNEEVPDAKAVDKEVRSKALFFIIDAAVTNKNSVLSEKTVNKMKVTCIVFLEIASTVTTAIGMMIISSDISPLIAIIWAVVIQVLVGLLSASKGGWNTIILVICLVVSVGSDYVCYVNVVKPYDTYLEKEYNGFKESYDIVQKNALERVSEYASLEDMADVSFENVERSLSLLESKYNESAKEEELSRLKEELGAMDSVIRYNSGETAFQNDGNFTIDFSRN
ncbi:hypothetical protein Hs30E_11180 [Lactococcus hodotermopsidis]|uniref:Uncharacterized protein n=1 Tax=Pseudolactococcus hodotermopsidis TaxID=2709157 RepID=A0A6A0BFG3_9LACT|nr:hypothetical protein [Lactococcus hodotermopsidis]GFH42567.1 hypothetical protein Hs30E_11180 [Lactococcus hodotermopsidis]